MDEIPVLRMEKLKKYLPLKKGICHSLVKQKGASHVRAVDDISFNVGEKEILGFVGESGCGKSTMSRAILQLIEPTGGKVFFKETRVDTLRNTEVKPYRKKMQMIFKDPFESLTPRRTV